ncbi:hypothetical protein TOT_030000671 [Theileria orientalis strain Shintoku]|uniref:Uncharacterized protein n=1 Tax=Theileria orientalis strain Shintoku TaxID=869250 RepID=J4DPW4_THEOR|nr:hypothetical protein TOT_030000671 [Theileria orientalis strain Shintoku]BAM41409.1 hypothetical protein TOT_030000671 [Theileria orientalis strain Shintoku]|eukprot:XP_009691710.1 hypothetical protein TOT_030000671 [Theileria orientalis strain Shintoku]
MIKDNITRASDSNVYLGRGRGNREFPHSRPCREMGREIHSRYFGVKTKYHLK